jgi:hypothetical protein
MTGVSISDEAARHTHFASVLTDKVKSIGYSIRAERAHMKLTGRVFSLARAEFFALILIGAIGLNAARAQNEPILVPEAVEYRKLLAILPEPPPGWAADKPEGSTEDVGGFKITNVHRDYHKGEGEKAPSAAISILDSVSNPDYVSATTEAWKSTSDTSEGYAKSVTIEGNPGFETFEKDTRHAALWVMVADRYFVQIELQNQEPAELQEWIKRIDLKKLAGVK